MTEMRHSLGCDARAVIATLLTVGFAACAPAPAAGRDSAAARAEAQPGSDTARPASAAPVGADTLPLVDVAKPSVIAVWAVPPESLLNADDGLASAYDQFMYFLAESRPRLDSLGVENLDQPLAWADRRLRVRSGARVDTVGLRDTVMVTGYVLAAPGRAPRVLEGLLVDEDLADSVRAHFRRPPR